MKKFALLTVAAVICISSGMVSCSGLCDVDINPAPTPVCFIVKDGDGNNLLDADFEGNILDDGIEVTFLGKKYPLILSEYDYSDGMGLHTGKIGPDNTPGIMFWYFFVARDSGGSQFTINWGDGISDEVKFDFYYTVVWCKPKSHQKIYMNGIVQSENSLTITIVK